MATASPLPLRERDRVRDRCLFRNRSDRRPICRRSPPFITNWQIAYAGMRPPKRSTSFIGKTVAAMAAMDGRPPPT